MTDIALTLLTISIGITFVAIFLTVCGIIGMFVERKNTQSKGFKLCKKFTFIGLFMACVGFGIYMAFFANVPFC